MKIEREVIVRTCKGALEDVQERRTKRFHQQVDNLMASWWFRLFHRDDRSKAEDKIRSKTSYDQNHFRCVGTTIEYNAEEILALVSVAHGDVIDLDGDDSQFIADWAKRNL